MNILASGLSGSTETAQSQVSVGMGLLAGSTVMLLTILWGTCLVVGKCDLENSVAVDQKDTKTFSLTGNPFYTSANQALQLHGFRNSFLSLHKCFCCGICLITCRL